jgi:hypothetical protein
MHRNQPVREQQKKENHPQARAEHHDQFLHHG